MIHAKIEGLTEAEARSAANALDRAFEHRIVDGVDAEVIEAIVIGLRQVAD